MTKEFELDLSKFERALKKSPEAIAEGSKLALDDIKNDWVRQAVDVAPVDSGNLRAEIYGEAENNLVEVFANATDKNDFNYAYYIHELDAGGAKLRTPGTVKKFLDDPAEKSLAKWQRWLEEEIEKSLKNTGW